MKGIRISESWGLNGLILSIETNYMEDYAAGMSRACNSTVDGGPNSARQEQSFRGHGVLIREL